VLQKEVGSDGTRIYRGAKRKAAIFSFSSSKQPAASSYFFPKGHEWMTERLGELFATATTIEAAMDEATEVAQAAAAKVSRGRALAKRKRSKSPDTSPSKSRSRSHSPAVSVSKSKEKEGELEGEASPGRSRSKSPGPRRGGMAMDASPEHEAGEEEEALLSEEGDFDIDGAFDDPAFN
jgi:hypothetical protein